jgi:hypothetical protein
MDALADDIGGSEGVSVAKIAERAKPATKRANDDSDGSADLDD